MRNNIANLHRAKWQSRFRCQLVFCRDWVIDFPLTEETAGAFYPTIILKSLFLQEGELKRICSLKHQCSRLHLRTKCPISLLFNIHTGPWSYLIIYRCPQLLLIIYLFFLHIFDNQVNVYISQRYNKLKKKCCNSATLKVFLGLNTPFKVMPQHVNWI